jgi:hypothetical protein
MLPYLSRRPRVKLGRFRGLFNSQITKIGLIYPAQYRLGSSISLVAIARALSRLLL